ncbi:hypothetical protein QBC33DRAFT_519815 [Phialemonium atrogriseum]|uniref:Uncharacterized protein n=1 Tax=Phialemonium atrogriseum TaxID=1093897 RepID=A0AAJ0FB64_9PEZI|nr:uncharacterized protein QBC33DRAFT_519815 [Phialemonium atrogriseum]KAK1762146.1 hypothetical protein QBC33DRAFT_519815 [Phialemonium atrogriseum]
MSQCNHPYGECLYDAGDRLVIRLIEEGRSWDEYQPEEQELWQELFRRHPHFNDQATTAGESSVQSRGVAKRLSRAHSLATVAPSISDLSNWGTLPSSPTGLPRRALLRKQEQTTAQWAEATAAANARAAASAVSPTGRPGPGATPSPRRALPLSPLRQQRPPTTPFFAPRSFSLPQQQQHGQHQPPTQHNYLRPLNIVANDGGGAADEAAPLHDTNTGEEEDDEDDGLDAQRDAAIAQFVAIRYRMNRTMQTLQRDEAELWSLCGYLHDLGWFDAGGGGGAAPAPRQGGPDDDRGWEDDKHHHGLKYRDPEPNTVKKYRDWDPETRIAGVSRRRRRRRWRREQWQWL